MRRFGHYETIVYDLHAASPVATPLPAPRPNYTQQNAELYALECVADLGSRICIGLCIGFMLGALAFWS